jgi:hypothetical protein
MTYTNSLNSLPNSRNISPRAAQLLQEIQQKLAKKDMNGNERESIGSYEGVQIEGADKTLPRMSGSNEKSVNGIFSKEEYELDIRGRRILNLLGSIVILLIIAYSTQYFFNDLVINTISALKTKASEVKAAPEKIIQLDEQIENLLRRKKEIETNYLDLSNQFTDPSGVYNLYSTFLETLNNNKVELIAQQATIDQSKISPLMNLQLTDDEKAFQSLVSSLKVGADGHVQLQGASGTAIGNALGSKDLVLSGDVKEGLNYYHLELMISGSYVGYLTARQTLINQIPNAIIHRELIQTNPNNPNELAIKIYLSIPFVNSK